MTTGLIGALPELALALPSEVTDQPVGVEGVLRRHSPAHDGVEEGFPLAGVETEDLEVAAGDLTFLATAQQVQI